MQNYFKKIKILSPFQNFYSKESKRKEKHQILNLALSGNRFYTGMKNLYVDIFPKKYLFKIKFESKIHGFFLKFYFIENRKFDILN